MSSYNNRRNRSIRRGIDARLDDALDAYNGQDLCMAENLCRLAGEGFSQRGVAGSEWDQLSQKHAQICELLYGTCECWHCSFSFEQKEKVQRLTEEKASHLSVAYSNEDKNFTGAFAEVVFGMHFALGINLKPGRDGGVDFTISSDRAPTGVLTIDVKGTTVAQYTGTSVKCTFPQQIKWNRAANHIYVLLHVVGRKHVFFRGFAFGNDPVRTESVAKGLLVGRCEGPRPERTLRELEAIIDTDVAATYRTTASALQNTPIPATPAITIATRDVVHDVAKHGLGSALRRKPRFLIGMKVRHPKYGEGTVVQTGEPCLLYSLRAWDENVRIDFGAVSRVVAAVLARLEMADQSRQPLNLVQPNKHPNAFKRNSASC